MSTSALYKPGMPWPWPFPTSDNIFIWYHSVVGVIGVSLNSFALASIYFSPPLGLRNFKMIILLMIIVNLLECIASVLMMVRLIPSYPSSVHIYDGPCNLFGPRVCHGIMAVQMHFAIFQCSLLLFAFINRFNIVRNQEMSVIRRIACFVAGYVPAFSIMILFTYNYIEPEENRPLSSKALSEYDLTNYRIIGQLNNVDKLELLNYIFISFYPSLVIGAAIFIRIITQNRLKIFPGPRLFHKTMLNASMLTYQLIHPLAMVIGNIFYFIAMIFDVHVPLLEHMTIGLWSSVAAISPIIFFIHLDSFKRFCMGLWNSLSECLISLIQRVSNYRSTNQ